MADPAEQVLILRAGPRQGLKHVVMGVDQPREGHATTRVDSLVDIERRRGSSADPSDHAIVDENGPLGNLATLIIHGDDHIARIDQGTTHAPLLSA
jgi:hypothetical protein